MLKKIISAVSALAIAASIAPAAFAEDDIEIMYNGSYMEFDDVSPELINDRTMLPFRKILETMGAEVTYDEATDTAKAVRGDTTVEFTLTGTTVTVTAGGEVSTIEMDVAPVLKNDRTLVPVRFMSEALSMNVGWDGDSQTVYIVDMEKYLDDIKDTAPTFYELLSAMSTNSGEFVSDMTLELSANNESKEAGEDADADVYEISAAVKNNKLADTNVIELSGNLKMDAGDSFGSLLSSNMIDIEGLELTTAALDDKIYMQTNMFEKLSDANPTSGKLLAASVFLNAEEWLRIERSDIESGKFGGNDMIDMVETIADMSFSGLIAAMIPSGDVTADTAETINSLFEYATVIEKGLAITKTGDNSYTYTLAVTQADIETDLTTLEINASGTVTNGVETECSVSLIAKGDTSADNADEYEKTDVTLTLISKVDTSATPTVPEYDEKADNISMYLSLAGLI